MQSSLDWYQLHRAARAAPRRMAARPGAASSRTGRTARSTASSLPGLILLCQALPGLLGWRRVASRNWCGRAKAQMEIPRPAPSPRAGVPTISSAGLAASGVLLPTPVTASSSPRSSPMPSRSMPTSRSPCRSSIRPAAARAASPVELGRFLARMHDAGVMHHDLHPGNLLFAGSMARPALLYLIDLHAVQLGRPAIVAASRANLVMLNRWFILRGEPVGPAAVLAGVSAPEDVTGWRLSPCFPIPMLSRDLEASHLGSNLALLAAPRPALPGQQPLLPPHPLGEVRGHAMP